jgi:hypothetical protein
MWAPVGGLSFFDDLSWVTPNLPYDEEGRLRAAPSPSLPIVMASAELPSSP